MTTSTLQHNDNKAVEVENRVIKKLFRRLITFLFVLFVFSFLDRINIGFAGLTMGKDLGLTSTMFGIRRRRCSTSPTCCAGSPAISCWRKLARAAGSPGSWWSGDRLDLHHVRHQPAYAVHPAHAGRHRRGRFSTGDPRLSDRWFPAYHRARANALFMIAMPVTMMLGSILSGYILALDGLWNLKGWQWLFLLEGLPSVVLGVVTGSSSTTRRIKPTGWITKRNRR